MKVLPLPPPFPPAGIGTAAALRALASALHQGVVTTNTQGIVTFWSEEVARITGFGAEETVGKPWSDFVGDSPRGAAGPSSVFASLRARSGRELRVLRNAVELVGDDGAVLGVLETLAEAPLPVAAVSSAREADAAPAARDDATGLVGHHPVMRELRKTIERLARSGATVMIQGESGTGKDLVARAIHGMGSRASRPFVRVSCALLEGDPTALFGSAYGDRRGRIDEANGGTLFLDEVGDLPAPDQARLLRFIEQRATPDSGGGRTSLADVRLLCSSHRDLQQVVADGRLRADLYFRLAVLPLLVPSLRAHADDVPEIAAALLSRRESKATFSPGAVAALRAYFWPGNVRELDNVLEGALLVAGEGEIRPEHLPVHVAAAAGPAAQADAASQNERERTIEALVASEWNRTRAAAVLGISRVTLWKRMRRHGLSSDAESAPEDE